MSGKKSVEEIVQEILSGDTLEFFEDVVRGAARFGNDLPGLLDRLQFLHGVYAPFALDFDSKMSERAAAETYTLIQQTSMLIKEKASTDPLTGMLKRDFALRKDMPSQYAILMMDIDHFKQWNDTYGHDIGDIALKVTAEIIRENVRRTEGFVARYGGEEFYIALNRISDDNAAKVAEKIRYAVEHEGMQKVYAELEAQEGHEEIQKLKDNSQKLTISIGVAVEQQGKRQTAVLKRADIALYNAKNSGRNNVKLYKEDMPMPFLETPKQPGDSL